MNAKLVGDLGQQPVCSTRYERQARTFKPMISNSGEVHAFGDSVHYRGISGSPGTRTDVLQLSIFNISRSRNRQDRKMQTEFGGKPNEDAIGDERNIG
jgi:hypothetical protein